jgi:hypothetical protein
MIDTKWWVFCLFVWIVLAFSFTILEGHTTVDTTEYSATGEASSSGVTTLDKLNNLKFNFASLGNLGSIMYDVATWNFGFLNTGGVIVTALKGILMILSAVVVLPLMFELARLILKPFGG